MGAAVLGDLFLVIIVALAVCWMRRDTTIGKEAKEDEHVQKGAGYQNIPHHAVVEKPQNGKKYQKAVARKPNVSNCCKSQHNIVCSTCEDR